MPRKFKGEIDQELLRTYIIPALRDLSHRLNNPLSAADGRAWPGRAKTAELAADHLEDLLGIVGELRTDVLRAKYNRPTKAGLVAQTFDTDADDWLAAMERDAAAGSESAQAILANQAALAELDARDEKNQLDATGYPCKVCNLDIKPGDQVGAGMRGICHIDCLMYS